MICAVFCRSIGIRPQVCRLNLEGGRLQMHYKCTFGHVALLIVFTKSRYKDLTGFCSDETVGIACGTKRINSVVLAQKAVFSVL